MHAIMPCVVCCQLVNAPFRLLLQCCMATYPDPSLREELERLWRDQCYMRAYTNRLGIIQRLESALTQSALVAKVHVIVCHGVILCQRVVIHAAWFFTQCRSS